MPRNTRESFGGKKTSGGTGFTDTAGRVTQRVQITSGDRDYDESGDKQRAAIVNSFLDFGYNPTEAEIASLLPSARHAGEQGRSAVANYVQTKRNQIEQEANDPLNKVLEAQQTFAAAQEAAAKGFGDEANSLFGQLKDLLGQAPKLFGNLTPEQIDQYVAPVKAQVAGDAARRGLAGSSTEINALTGSVLQKGLEAGQIQQQLQAQALQNEISRKTALFQGAVGAQQGALGLENQSAGQLSNQAFQNQQTISSLPLYLQALAMQEHAAAVAANQGGGTKAGIIGGIQGALQGGATGFLIGGPVGGVAGAVGGGVLGGLSASSGGPASSGSNSLLPLAFLRGTPGSPATTPSLSSGSQLPIGAV